MVLTINPSCISRRLFSNCRGNGKTREILNQPDSSIILDIGEAETDLVIVLGLNEVKHALQKLTRYP